MSDMLSIGASGVRAYQTALGVVSDNIANVGSAGYSRRTTELREIAPVGSSGLSSRAAVPGHGVVVGGIGRAGDAYKAAAVRLASTDLARTEAGTTWLSRIEQVMTQGATAARMTGFFASAQRLAADPTSLAARASMLEQAGAAADAFRTTAGALQAAEVELDGTLDAGARQLSSLAQGLAKINEGLGRAAPGSTAAAALFDQRDQLLEQMSAITDVAVQMDTAGRASVRVGGTSGPVLVAGREASSVAFNRNEDGAVAFIVRRGGEQFDFTPMGGALAGMAEGAVRLSAARIDLNGVAERFAATVNDAMRAGDDLNGQPGRALFDMGDPPSALTMTLEPVEPEEIAAAARGGGRRDATNLAALQAARTASGVEEAGAQLVTGVAGAIEARKTVTAAQTAIRDAAVAALDAQTGVDLDQEAIDLIRFQQAYAASSRVIQVAREVMQSLLDIR
jgi:flagellar hook-associated protein FlgK